MGWISEEWMARAACLTAPTWVDFVPIVELGEDPSPAQAYCASCPVTGECLLWALAHDEMMGVWGGMTETERRLVKPDDVDEWHPCTLCGSKTCTVKDAACDACMFTVEISLVAS